MSKASCICSSKDVIRGDTSSREPMKRSDTSSREPMKRSDTSREG
jgi:hypothetical protein